MPTSSLATYRADFGEPILHGVDSDTLVVEPILTGLSTLDADGGTLSFGGTIDMHNKGTDVCINVHIHADVDQASLFPTSQRGKDGESPTFTIR